MLGRYFFKSVDLWVENDKEKSQFSFKYKRALIPLALLLLLANQSTRLVTIETLSDAFWAVSAYVAFTLAIYHYLSIYMDKENSIIRLYNSSRNYQVFFSALLGALPGCGGAIVVTTQFVSGRVGFGAIVAVLTSTMGDAAFLLLASDPQIGLSMVAMGVVVGTISGLVVNLIHNDDFLRPAMKDVIKQLKCSKSANGTQKAAINLQGHFWKVIIIPATVIAGLGSFQIDINELLHLPSLSIELIGTVLIITCMVLWAITKEVDDYESIVAEDNKCIESHPLQKAAQDTNFVTAWVIVAFLSFELITMFTGTDLAQLFSGWGIWMPLVGLLVGLLPGCGPQILVTSLYISGAVPMSTQIANSISNDGDALFPAIALAPKAALAATFYSAVPAIVVGYAYYFLFEF
jgi:hypothetical protein